MLLTALHPPINNTFWVEISNDLKLASCVMDQGARCGVVVLHRSILILSVDMTQLRHDVRTSNKSVHQNEQDKILITLRSKT